ncbi:MAG: hypothetical protein IPJ40_22035 [Saprospirales bacterium]|nr:hypothetical protein [Saprospirales bacterium]
MKARIPFLALLALVCSFNGLLAQKGFENWLKQKEGARIEPFLMLQLWSNYSMGQEVYNPTGKYFEPVDDRFNVLLRRGRFGLRAQPYEGLKFTLVTAFDGIGKDVLTGVIGSPNNLSAPKFFIWDAFFQWKVQKNSEAFNLVGGYFRPQLSRESITSGWSVNSMEKAMSQTYIRKHLVGTGPGRALGFNLGGLWLPEGQKWGLNYNLGIFNPLFQSYSGNSIGKQFSPLITGRVVAYTSAIRNRRNTALGTILIFRRPKGLSLGAGGAWQGATDLFKKSYAVSTDLLFNWGSLNIDGEWNWMWRDGYSTQTGHVRAGYNLVLHHRYFLEPALMVMQFNGASDLPGQSQAATLGASSGSETTYDAGLNWYLNKNRLKLMLHYTWYTGDAGEAAGTPFTGNTYFNESGVGAIHRGNWVGLGVNAIF